MTIRILLCVSALLSGWIAVLAGVMLMSDQAPAALVMMPDEAFLTNLPKGVGITARNAVSVTVIGAEEDFAASLYRVGAWLVLPSGLRGCAPPATNDLSLPPRQFVSAAGP